MALTKTGLTFVNGQAPALNGANMNAIVDLTDDIVDYIETPSYTSETEETKEIISLPSTVVTSQFNATIKGNTVVNLLDDDVAGCESTTGWVTIGTSSIALDASDKVEGNNSLNITTSTINNGRRYEGIALSSNSYYFISFYYKITSGIVQFTLYDNINAAFLKGSTFLSSTSWVRVGFVIQTTNASSDVWLQFKQNDGTALDVNIDAIQLQKISASEYALSDDASLEKYTYHRGTKSTDKIRLKSVGKNLFDGRIIDGSFYDVTDGVTINTNSTRSRSEGYTTVDSNTEYRFQVSDTTTSSWYVYYYDSAKNFISRTGDVENLPFTTPSNCKYIRWSIITGGGDLNLKGTKVWITKGSTATTYEPYTKTQATCPVKLHSVPTIQDEWEVDTGKITKNVKEYITTSSNITALITSPANVDYISIQKPLDFIGYNSLSTAYDNSILSAGYRQYTGGGYDDANKIGALGSSGGALTFTLVVAKGTYATLLDAQNALAGTTIYYQLATPEISYTQPAILNAEANGTVYVEPYIAEDKTAQFYSSGLVLDSNYPLSSLNDIDEINKYDLETGIITPVSISDLTLVSSTSITISGAVNGELYALSYNYRNLSTIGTVEHSFGTNLKAQCNDNTEGLKLLDAKVNRNIIETDIKIDNHKNDLLPHFDYAYETDYTYDGSGNITVVDYSVASVLRRKDTITYSGVDISTVNIKVYDLDGTTILEEYTDTLTYSSGNITNITRTVV